MNDAITHTFTKKKKKKKWWKKNPFLLYDEMTTQNYWLRKEGKKTRRKRADHQNISWINIWKLKIAFANIWRKRKKISILDRSFHSINVRHNEWMEYILRTFSNQTDLQTYNENVRVSFLYSFHSLNEGESKHSFFVYLIRILNWTHLAE